MKVTNNFLVDFRKRVKRLHQEIAKAENQKKEYYYEKQRNKNLTSWDDHLDQNMENGTQTENTNKI